MPAITISREIGSKGDLIAEQTAKRLGYQLVDKNTIEKIVREYGFVDFKEVYNQTGFWARFDPHHAEVLKLFNQVIEAVVYHGNVILLGRGGFALLKGYADVLNVRIQAPFSLRVKHVMEQETFASRIKAEEFVRDSDQMRREFVESVYGNQWDSASAFDLVIDMRKISIEMAVDWLEAAAHKISHLQTGEAPTTRMMEFDPVLLDSVAQVLDKQPA
jgi:cytidylate kinase